ncbi:MAG: hypothetical protein KGR71_16120 [Proteobacteria bacterium]|nr:hypothetical protein [Pseudomonadota bacterium]
MPKEIEVFADYTEYARERTHAGTELTREMIVRSREQLEHARDILKTDVPKIWRPKPK